MGKQKHDKGRQKKEMNRERKVQSSFKTNSISSFKIDFMKDDESGGYYVNIIASSKHAALRVALNTEPEKGYHLNQLYDNNKIILWDYMNGWLK